MGLRLTIYMVAFLHDIDPNDVVRAPTLSKADEKEPTRSIEPWNLCRIQFVCNSTRGSVAFLGSPIANCPTFFSVSYYVRTHFDYSSYVEEDQEEKEAQRKLRLATLERALRELMRRLEEGVVGEELAVVRDGNRSGN